jgi:hypothetical protein
MIYVDTTKICFTIKDRKEKFSFKDHILYSPAHSQKAYLPKETTTVTNKKNSSKKGIRARRDNNSDQQEEEQNEEEQD